MDAIPGPSGLNIGAPPPYCEYDPNNRLPAQSDVDYANSMLGLIAAKPPFIQKRIIERVIAIHNSHAPSQNEQVLLANAEGFSLQYPKLDRLIEKLDFIPGEDVGFFAFSCGLYSEYCEAKITTRSTTQLKRDFFQKYFLTKGSDQGVANLYLFQSCDILQGDRLRKFSTALENIDVECLPGSPTAVSINPDFDFPTVFTIVVKQLNFNSALPLRLNLSDDYEQLLERTGHNEPDRFKVMVMLHEFAQRGGRDTDLLVALEQLERRDLSEELEKALRYKIASFRESPPPVKKSKHLW